jgi:hypothetical protein
MTKTANSIECPCGGNYVKKNKSRHMKTKKHQAYEQLHENVCGNHGCGTELDEDEMIVYSLSRNGVETRWCEECFDNDGAEARRNGWVFDQDGEDILNEREQQVCIHCGERATMEDSECPLCHMYQDLFRCTQCDAMSSNQEQCSECGYTQV